MAGRPALPRRLQKILFQEVGSKCPLCLEDNVSSLTIHHIVAYAMVKTHDPRNLIVLCANCHARAQNFEVSTDELFEIKRKLDAEGFRDKRPVRTDLTSPSVQRGSGGIAAGRDVNVRGNVVIKYGSRRQPRAAVAIPGTVSEDKWKLGYLKYLGHRFNKFKEFDMRTRGEKMEFAVIWMRYRDQIGFSVGETPLEIFRSAADFLAHRIDGTVLGRKRNKLGQKNYRNFDEYVRLGDDPVDFPQASPSTQG